MPAGRTKGAAKSPQGELTNKANGNDGPKASPYVACKAGTNMKNYLAFFLILTLTAASAHGPLPAPTLVPTDLVRVGLTAFHQREGDKKYAKELTQQILRINNEALEAPFIAHIQL